MMTPFLSLPLIQRCKEVSLAVLLILYKTRFAPMAFFFFLLMRSTRKLGAIHFLPPWVFAAVHYKCRAVGSRCSLWTQFNTVRILVLRFTSYIQKKGLKSTSLLTSSPTLGALEIKCHCSNSGFITNLKEEWPHLCRKVL